jgi:hypothetical protein
MPAMIRVSNKAAKINYAILGKPSNLSSKRSALQRKIDKALWYDNTAQVR